MIKDREFWDISAVVWHDACTSIDDPSIGTVPTISFGVVAPDKTRGLIRVVHDLTAMHGGSPGALTAIHKAGMATRVIFLAKLAIPAEFKEYWDRGEGHCEY